MSFILIFFYIFVLTSIIFTIFFIGHKCIKQHKTEEYANQLEELLDSAPDGYFYETKLRNGSYSYSSRRLCLMLNVVDKKVAFSKLLEQLDEEEAPKIDIAYNKLKESGTPFDINISSKNGLFHFTLTGRVLYTPNSHLKTFVVWFKDTTEKTALLIEERQSYIHILKQREILTQTLNALPFPLCMQDNEGCICFANKIYDQEKEDNADTHWVELPLKLNKSEKNYLLKYGQDKTTEEGLTALLNDAERAHRMLLKELPYGIIEFDATAKLSYFNTRFCDIWGIEQHFLKRNPSFEELLDKVQEKGVLPQVKDFAQYKKLQLSTFAQLTKTTEDFLYLSGGKIIRRLIIPVAKGGILILDENKT